jgi:arylsulfatase A-like enzyme
MYKHLAPGNERTFAAMVTCMDDAIGQIISALNKRGMRRNTLIVFCSDNGGMSFVSDNGPFRGEKGLLYEGGIRVPAFVVWPGVLKAGAVVKEPLHMVDMYPTLLALAAGRFEQPLPLDGKDAWATIAEGKPSPHEEILLNVTPYNGALRQGHWKVVHNGNLTANYTGGPPTVDTYELFNLSEDPFEKNDLSRTNPEKLKELQQRLRSYAAEAVPANIPPSRMPEDCKIPSAWGHPD